MITATSINIKVSETRLTILMTLVKSDNDNTI